MLEKEIHRKFLKIEPYLHGLLWCLVLLYPYIKYMGKEGGYSMPFLHELNALFFKVTISYFLYLWFYPKKQKLKHLPMVILVFVVNILVYQYLDNFFHPKLNHFWIHFVSNTLTYVGFGIVFFAVYYLKKGHEQQFKIDQLFKEKQQAEIKALKARVNPHFLFNTLNTIYANALKKEDKTPDLILKLSDGFRYLLHEGQSEFVTIAKELQHIKDYIDLQKERLIDKVEINFIETIDNQIQEITPLLFIGFIENAFKYTSVLKGQYHKIDINIQLKNKHLIFSCTNPFSTNFEQEIEAEWKESGLGIKNIKERLRLLYPDKHTLQIKDNEDLFSVELTILL